MLVFKVAAILPDEMSFSVQHTNHESASGRNGWNLKSSEDGLNSKICMNDLYCVNSYAVVYFSVS